MQWNTYLEKRIRRAFGDVVQYFENPIEPCDVCRQHHEEDIQIALILLEDQPEWDCFKLQQRKQKVMDYLRGLYRTGTPMFSIHNKMTVLLPYRRRIGETDRQYLNRLRRLASLGPLGEILNQRHVKSVLDQVYRLETPEGEKPEGWLKLGFTEFTQPELWKRVQEIKAKHSVSCRYRKSSYQRRKVEAGLQPLSVRTAKRGRNVHQSATSRKKGQS